jgi:hypothetical protein
MHGALRALADALLQRVGAMVAIEGASARKSALLQARSNDDMAHQGWVPLPLGVTATCGSALL